MSTAHRPTWDPAQAKDVKGGSRQFSVRDMAAHTKLKFRFVCNNFNFGFFLFVNYYKLKTHNFLSDTFCRQVGQTSTDEVKKRDLRAELLAAEQDAKNKKRKAEGKPPLGIEDAVPVPEDDESNKRRKLLQEALELDKDDDDDDDEKEEKEEKDENERYRNTTVQAIIKSWINLLKF